MNEIDIIVVDDDKLHRRIVAAMSQRLGVRSIRQFERASAFVQAVRDLKSEAKSSGDATTVCLLDMNIPGEVAGPESWAVIWPDMSTSGLMIPVACTADTTTETRRKCEDIGFGGVLTKPFSQEDLRRAIASFVVERRRWTSVDVPDS
jgi:CheY-like chemotaxis protein